MVKSLAEICLTFHYVLFVQVNNKLKFCQFHPDHCYQWESEKLSLQDNYVTVSYLICL